MWILKSKFFNSDKSFTRFRGIWQRGKFASELRFVFIEIVLVLLENERCVCFNNVYYFNQHLYVFLQFLLFCWRRLKPAVAMVPVMVLVMVPGMVPVMVTVMVILTGSNLYVKPEIVFRLICK